ncbi:SurA N-terminal domain-containing protein [Actinacidiphila sp. ITFR-21]|uniref:SurA N-terminal domain-containing protein n=1 Tax=Actinacidiphila sp. ITFR-21 TaxID=3075199 RepID=UPI00288903F7|nr:SurA N-terminal domain-containing protein [Streptomyces sp. ITFR-21]WNI15834.1 SurA N-terminal domain-containing protein [Streptomyces sp. ITFR-21]
MVRRRTAVSIAAAGLLLASPALTACGSGPAHAGAAAVVGDHRITVSTLQAEVTELRTEVSASPQGAQLLDSAGDLSTQMLGRLVEDQVLDRALAKAHLTVTDGEVQRDRQAALAQFGGNEAQLDSTLLVNYGVAKSDIDHFFYRDVASGKLIQSLGYQPGSDGGNTALTQEVVKTADSIGVSVNPRYGTWDAKKASIGAQSDPWVVDRTPVDASLTTDSAATADGGA